ncbi:hypothetical protein CK203_023972 [Vitis vinifera]|uniref:Uncharacterized protein n=1 Tax=Vitis vinifera TaxID=29760 RepID=A0A438IQ28_VITVI|nr:hypothetical protein CK203_023972 [Vitis vinifera]
MREHGEWNGCMAWCRERKGGEGHVVWCRERKCGKGIVVWCRERKGGEGHVVWCRERKCGEGHVVWCRERKCGEGIVCGVEREKVMRKKMRELGIEGGWLWDSYGDEHGMVGLMGLELMDWVAGFSERNEATVWVQRGDGVGFIKVVDLGKSPPANAAGWNYMNAVLENYSLGVTCHGYTKSR